MNTDELLELAQRMLVIERDGSWLHHQEVIRMYQMATSPSQIIGMIEGFRADQEEALDVYNRDLESARRSWDDRAQLRSALLEAAVAMNEGRMSCQKLAVARKAALKAAGV